MTDDGREPRTGDSVTPGRTVAAGRRTLPAAHLEVVTAPGYRQRRGGASARPVHPKEMPMA
jgi:hypothetical protein